MGPTFSFSFSFFISQETAIFMIASKVWSLMFFYFISFFPYVVKHNFSRYLKVVTSQGIMTDREAREKQIGGKLEYKHIFLAHRAGLLTGSHHLAGLLGLGSLSWA